MVNGVYKCWRVACKECDNVLTMLMWDYQLPTNCRCGGEFYLKHANAPDFAEGVSIRYPEQKPVFQDTVTSNAYSRIHATTEEEILRDIGDIQ